MSGGVDVKFRVDGVNVDRVDGCGLRYGEEVYYSLYTGDTSVLIDIDTDEMVKVIKNKGYEVKKISD